MRIISVKDFGAIGDGAHNDAPAFQAALDAGADIVMVPYGKYAIGQPLLVGSGTRLHVHKSAVIRLGDRVCVRRGQFLLSNRDVAEGNEGIEIRGGIWDGNNQNNPRGELFDPNSPSGSMFNFRNVKNLVLSDMVLMDSECYYIRMCEVDGFLIEKIAFETVHLRPNQDGVHLNGFCKNGIIRHLTGTPGSPNDDFVALNADDCMTRLENLDMVCGPIENIGIHDLASRCCHSFVRLLSVDSTIANINISKLRGGCKAFVLNIDAARYCRTPLIEPDSPRYQQGVGDVRDVTVDDVAVYAMGNNKSMICLESNLHRFKVRNFRIMDDKNAAPPTPIINLSNVAPSRVVMTGLKPAQCEGFAYTRYTDESGKEKCAVDITTAAGEAVWLKFGDFDSLDIDQI